MSIKGTTAIAGIGTTQYYRRGESGEKGTLRLCCEAILAACDDAGIAVEEIDGFCSYSDSNDAGVVASALGIPEVRHSSEVWGGGGNAPAAISNAVAAIVAGFASVVVVYHAISQGEGARFGQAAARSSGSPASDFYRPFGLMPQAAGFGLIVRRHMYQYGTKHEHLGQVAVTQRYHARHNPRALMQKPLTLEEYQNSRMIADPFRLFDCCMENDGGAAIIVTAAERARDLRQKPAYILAVSEGGTGRWGTFITRHDMPEEIYASSGHRAVATNLYRLAGVGPGDIDVAEIYDHFSGMVILQLEDYGFCEIGEGGPFVAEKRMQWPDGDVPVNTHGGNLSEVYLHGMTHPIEGVRQIRGEAACQVRDAELCLVTGAPAPIPMSSLILSR